VTGVHANALVLAAGLSTRMGTPKPLLSLDGAPAVVRAAQTFRDVGIEPVVVLGHEAERVAAVLDVHGLRHVFNADYELGMYSSLQRGVRELTDGTSRFFVLPADCPLVRGESVGRLLRAARTHAARVIYPRHDGRRGHPPLLDATLIPAILSSEPRDGLRGILARVADRSYDVDVDDAGVLLDMDVRADHEQLDRLAKLERIPDRRACEELLARLDLPGSVLEHSHAVERVARGLAAALNAAGLGLNVRLLQAAALLHDIARTEPDHAARGAELLVGAGFPRVAVVVAGHMDPSPRAVADLGEAAVLFLADKLVVNACVVPLQQRMTTVEARFAGDGPALAAARQRLRVAATLARRVEEHVGAPLDAVLLAPAAGC
jgi:molybdenum cofactor cytidylyltransferase